MLVIFAPSKPSRSSGPWLILVFLTMNKGPIYFETLTILKVDLYWKVFSRISDLVHYFEGVTKLKIPSKVLIFREGRKKVERNLSIIFDIPKGPIKSD